MKYIIASALLALVSEAVQAQTSAGRVLFGGAFNYYGSKATTTIPLVTAQPTTRSTTWTLAPRAGYFVTDNLVVGGEVVRNYRRDVAESYSLQNGQMYASTTTFTTLDLGPFARYYHLLSDKVGFFGQLNAMYFRQLTRTTSTQPESFRNSGRARGGYASLRPGFVYFPSSKFGLELTLGYLGYGFSHSTTESSQPDFVPYETDNRNLNVSFDLSSLRVGAAFYLGH